MLNVLCLEGADNVQTHRRTKPAPHLHENKKPCRGAGFELEQFCRAPEDGSGVAWQLRFGNVESKFVQCRRCECAFSRREERLALRATGTVGAMIGKECVAPAVQIGKRFFVLKRGVNKGQ